MNDLDVLSINRPSLALLSAEPFRAAAELAWHTLAKSHDTPSRLVHAIEVDGSHIGLGRNRAVLVAIADRLDQHAAPWRQFVHAE